MLYLKGEFQQKKNLKNGRTGSQVQKQCLGSKVWGWGALTKIKRFLGSTIMTLTDFWEHLLVCYWDNLKKIQDTWIFLGAPYESFGSTFGPGNNGWETLLYLHS
jgi:hypothetical protein